MNDINTHISTILLVDDDEINNFYNESVFRDNFGFKGKIQVALNGKEALDYLTNRELAIENGGKYPCPELIFLDVNMPVMDGFEFLEEYHNLDISMKGKVVICMLTSSLNENDKIKAEKFDELSEFSNKPLQDEFLTKVINKYFQEK